MKLSALIVDDEPACRRDLRQVLENMADVVIVAEAGDVSSARAAAGKWRPHLVFLDIQLPGASGFDFVQEAEDAACVIFTTAYEQFAVRAFEIGATDYLLKPVEEERCRRAIDRARAALRLRGALAPSVACLQVEAGGLLRRVPVTAISALSAARNYIDVVFEGGTGLLRRPLDGLLEDLPAGTFCRVNRQQAVNLACVAAVSGRSRSHLHLVLKDGARVRVARRRAAEVLRRLAEKRENP